MNNENQKINFTVEKISEGLYIIGYTHSEECGYKYIYARQMKDDWWEHFSGRDTSSNTTGETFRTLDACIDDYKEITSNY